MPRPDTETLALRRKAAALLRAEGTPLRLISQALGVTTSTIQRDTAHVTGENVRRTPRYVPPGQRKHYLKLLYCGMRPAELREYFATEFQP